MYDVVRFLHVLLGALWVGGVMFVEAQVAVAKKQGKESYVRTSVQTQVTAARIYPAVVPLVALTAIYLIIAGDWGWGSMWVMTALGLWVVSLVTGIAYFAPKAAAFDERLSTEGATDGLVADLDKIAMVYRADVLLLLVILAMMIFKPGA